METFARELVRLVCVVAVVGTPSVLAYWVAMEWLRLRRVRDAALDELRKRLDFLQQEAAKTWDRTETHEERIIVLEQRTDPGLATVTRRR